MLSLVNQDATATKTSSPTTTTITTEAAVA